LFDLKLSLFGLHLPQDALAFAQGQTEILDSGLLHDLPNDEKLSSRQSAISPSEFRQDLHPDCPRHWSALSLERFQFTRPA
jgi:hypothetical protein